MPPHLWNLLLLTVAVCIELLTRRWSRFIKKPPAYNGKLEVHNSLLNVVLHDKRTWTQAAVQSEYIFGVADGPPEIRAP
jgi:hypothetical protein